MKPHIVDFLKYLESKGEKRVPLEVKLLYPDKFSPITKEDLTVKGSLDLSDSTIESLPDNLQVGGDLDLSGLKIKSLPDNLKVGGTLFLSGSKIKSLPDNLKVAFNLFLQDTNIESIPNNLKIGKNIYLWNTPLAELMTEDEIEQEIERKGGYVIGYVYII